ncbi:hypothetical protein KQ302_11005 [Synechococcus sp. CS-602]|uniref:hypothetical protein n=1 Tax=Synechococcaceae TaxID=1890426 RepID=UPI0008FF6ABB|nr:MULTISPECIES: hypothetical protein [Synechococcaceae]MCT4364008.1 hypothetical protein [Candidatus Regnicoccus frigidus MAG-AL1]APD47172.1 hypothetical protein BM449_01125 [Synechococcus sp. SynAce01]MCT0205619.1 hypothetical protein [Synechococcus sp. CS-602]MCT0245577.1 hypothetical protein [Synechococcus sp. CS-601]MCT4366321.1 hypothetical protein [Candidatus Regnicoccus frigidus MAG-AL2]
MNTTKYLLAKYIPDLHRFEPRNIGVIVWSLLGIEARFLAEYSDRPGEVDGRSIPSFVTSASAYRQWIRYWRDAVVGTSMRPLGGGDVVSSSSPGFIEVLQQTARGNFVVVDSGSVLDDISEEELPAVADQLFAQLIEANTAEEPRDIGFDELCDSLMTLTQLKDHRNFYDRYPVRCTVRGVDEEFFFSHAIANGTLERAYQRFPIPKRKSQIQKNRDSTAWMLESILNAKLITSDHTVLLVNATPEQLSQAEVDKSIRLLGSMSRVVNILDEAEALAEFGAAAQLPAH